MGRFDGIIRRPRLHSPPARAGASPAGSDAAPAPAADPDLRAQRDRLIERFTIMQSDLGGAFYEMAVRDHVRLDALTRKAAELQKIDAELSKVERAIQLERTGAVGTCASCHAPYGPGVAFCAQCGHSLIRTEGAA
jgi:hypothetical protein